MKMVMRSENTDASRRAHDPPRIGQARDSPFWDAGDEASTDQFDTEVGGEFKGDPIWDDGNQDMADVGHDQSLSS